MPVSQSLLSATDSLIEIGCVSAVLPDVRIGDPALLVQCESSIRLPSCAQCQHLVKEGMVCTLPRSSGQTVGYALLLQLPYLRDDVLVDDVQQAQLAETPCSVHSAFCIAMKRYVARHLQLQLFCHEFGQFICGDAMNDDDEARVAVAGLLC